MPKQRVTREAVVEAAFDLARRSGMEAVLVKDVAQALGCSVQPIYSYCGSMEGLRRAVEERTVQFVREYAAARRDPADPFRSTGLAYLELAREEPRLYRIFFLRRQEAVSSLDDLYRREATPEMAAGLAQALGIGLEQAKALHLHMILHSMGLGFLLASGAKLGEEAGEQLVSAYEIFLSKMKEETA